MKFAGQCCNNGEIDLPLLPPVPEVLHKLIDGTDPRSKHFMLFVIETIDCGRPNINRYNNSLSLASVGGDIGEPTQGGFRPVQFQGSMCHLLVKVGLFLVLFCFFKTFH